MSVRKQVLAVALTCAHVCACSDNPSQPPPAPTAVELTVSDMSPLSVDSLYELWAVQGVEYTSLGKFNVLFSQQIVDSQGTFLSRFSSTGDLSAATRLAVTIETHPDPAPATPTTLEIMTANITGDTLTLGFTKDYSQRTGTLVMITPSDGGGDIFAGPSSPDTSNPFGGLWFVSKPWGVPEFGLSPSMNPPPAGWTYEGWYMRPDGTFLSTGRFSDVLKVDDRAPYKNADPSMNVDSLLSLWTFPGEDFLQNAPMGWTFPLDVHTPGSMAFVTLEPEPDLSPAPFLHLTAYCKELTPAMVSNVQYPLDTPPLPSGVAVLK